MKPWESLILVLILAACAAVYRQNLNVMDELQLIKKQIFVKAGE